MSAEFVTKSAVSITEMARMIGLSRARFYQLVQKGTFPPPDKEPETQRPFFCEEKQRLCFEVRRRNCGINGKAILFYSRRRDFVAAASKPRTPKPERTKDVLALLDGLNSLGFTTATASQVEQITKEMYPQGTSGIDQGEVLRAVFLRIRRQNTGDSVG